MKIKIFCADAPDAAETAINEWLEADPGIEVVKIAQTQVHSDQKDGSRLTISIFYRATGPQQDRTGFTV